MIAVDTSTWVAYFQGERGEDTDVLDQALIDRRVVMLPVVLTELLSDSKLAPEASERLAELPLVEIAWGYWQRAGALRAMVLCRKRKARLGDALIAQNCLDARLALLTRDKDFRAFAEAAGLDLVIRPVR